MLSGTLLAWGLPVNAQDRQPTDPAKHAHAAKAPTAEQLADQIRDLQAQVAKLEAALKPGRPSTPSGSGTMGGTTMGGMQGKGLGGMGAKGTGGMQGKAMGGMAGMPMGMMGGMRGTEGGMPGMMGMETMGGKGMEMMGGMKGMGGMQMSSALPGFPGASHIYHVGATGFFLDHPEHIQLTTPQQAELNRLKEKALLEQGSAQRKIDEAEQELWTLTGSDQPDAAKIGTKMREVEKLRGDQRLAFIRAVGEAAKVLTDEQRKVLLGTVQRRPDGAPSHAGH